MSPARFREAFVALLAATWPEGRGSPTHSQRARQKRSRSTPHPCSPRPPPAHRRPPSPPRPARPDAAPTLGRHDAAPAPGRRDTARVPPVPSAPRTTPPPRTPARASAATATQVLAAAAPADAAGADRAALERMQAAVLEQARAEAAADAAPGARAASRAPPAAAPRAPSRAPATRARRRRANAAPARPIGPGPRDLPRGPARADVADLGRQPDRPDRQGAGARRRASCRRSSALHRLGPLLSSQLEREFYPRVCDRTVQRSLTAMRRAGWVRRFRLREPQGRGQPKYVYVLDRRGFDLARDIPGPRGPYIRDDARFVERRFESVLKPLHDLHANALAVRADAPDAARRARLARPGGERDRPAAPAPARRARTSVCDRARQVRCTSLAPLEPPPPARFPSRGRERCG